MKKYYLLASLLVLLAACINSTKTRPKPFTPSMLALQEFTIDPGRDTILHSLHGTVFTIAAGTFVSTSPVTIIVREAFTPAEILAAGLTTESNGRLLRSGGMIYFNALVNKEKLELAKPVGITVPATYYDSAMQLYKGVETDSGINWINPSPLDSTPRTQLVTAGGILFNSKCAPCHSNDMRTDATGPALANVEDRWPDRTKLFAWIRNNTKLTSGGYPRAIYTSRLKSTAMDIFPLLTDTDIEALLAYIDNETKKPDRPVVTDSTGNSPKQITCPGDTVYTPVAKVATSFFETVYADPLPRDVINSDTIPLPPQEKLLDDTTDRNSSFTVQVSTKGIYDFQIETTGWYNIDAAMIGFIGTAVVKIVAQPQPAQATDLHVYLFCPDRKILSEGYDRQGDKYFFDKIDGGIPLFPGDRAILFAFGSSGNKIIAGVKEFYIGNNQTIPIPVQEMTEDEIRQLLLSKQMSGIDLGEEKKEMHILERDCAEADTIRMSKNEPRTR